MSGWAAAAAAKCPDTPATWPDAVITAALALAAAAVLIAWLIARPRAVRAEARAEWDKEQLRRLRLRG